VRKLRVKLQQALPGWWFIHTHFGFGYRMTAEHKELATSGSQPDNTRRTACSETPERR